MEKCTMVIIIITYILLQININDILNALAFFPSVRDIEKKKKTMHFIVAYIHVCKLYVDVYSSFTLRKSFVESVSSPLFSYSQSKLTYYRSSIFNDFCHTRLLFYPALFWMTLYNLNVCSIDKFFFLHQDFFLTHTHYKCSCEFNARRQ